MAVRTVRSSRTSAAHAIMVVTGIVVGFIVVAILLTLAGANRNNMLVDFVVDVAVWLTRPFDNLFVRDNYTEEMLINWSIAAIVYFAIGSFFARLAGRH
jgi:hypothetical protein